MVQAFGITKDQMLKAGEILGKNKNTENLGNSSAWLAKGYEPESYQSADTSEKEVMFIQQGNTKGMTFKIKVNDLVFASLFDWYWCTGKLHQVWHCFCIWFITQDFWQQCKCQNSQWT